jgi:hypothetical protein
MRAPHPVRARETSALLFADLEQSMGPARFEAFQRHIRQHEHEFTSDVVQGAFESIGMREIYEVLREVSDGPSAGSNGTGNASVIETTIRSLISPPAHFLVDDDLVNVLMATEIDDDIPMRFLVPGQSRLFIEFGRRRDLDVTLLNSATGDHILEGAYVETTAAIGGTGTPDDPDRILKVVLTGSPLGKSHALDDAVFSFTLPCDDPDLPLNEAMAAAIRNARAIEAGRTPIPPQAWENAREALQLLVKALLYVSMSSARREFSREYTEARAQLGAIKSGSKLAKAQRQLRGLRDHILILPPAHDVEDDGDRPVGAQHRTVGAHWRRWHFRMQRHGKGNSLVKVVLIRQVLVNAAAGTPYLQPRSYRAQL